MKPVILFNILLLLTITGYKTHAQQQPAYTFVVTGDDRVRPEDIPYNTTSVDSINFSRILSEIDTLNPTPKYLFINGDLVYGYSNGKDTKDLERELTGWIALYEKSGLEQKGVQLVAIPGNHEVTDKKHVTQKADEETFARVMKKYIMQPNVPGLTSAAPGGLTYSFNFNGDHFVTLNTDTLGNTTDGSHIQSWLQKDLSANKTARHSFVFGHEPLHISQSLVDVGMTPDAYHESLWSIVQKNKCDIYFGSHIHMFDSICPPKNTTTWEIICGNAGMEPEKFWENPYYGYTIVKVYADSVHIISRGYSMGTATDKAGKPIADRTTYYKSFNSSPDETKMQFSIPAVKKN